MRINEPVIMKNLIRANLEALKIFDANNTCMTVEQAAEYLNVHQNTIKNRIHSGKIKATYLGVWRIPKIQFLDKILEQ